MKNHLRLDVSHPALYPEVGELLRRLPSGSSFHKEHRFRHPAAIYQLSIDQLSGDLIRVLDDLEALHRRLSPIVDIGFANRLAQSQRILVYSLREHIDDCQMILRCMVDPASVLTKVNLPDEYLRAAGLSERQLFWEQVRSRSDKYIMPLVNNLKHAQGRLRILTFHCTNSDIRSGFYLEEIDHSAVAQPSQELHGGNSAFSFGRDLRLNIAFVFRASMGLSVAFRAILKRLSLSLENVPIGAEISSNLWATACRRVAKLDSGVLPHEVKLPFTRIELLENGVLKIRELDRDQKLFCPLKGNSIDSHTVGDGVTVSFRMPYLLGNIPKIK